MVKLKKSSRLAVAVGGVLMFFGTILVITSALIFFDVTHVSVSPGWVNLFLWVLLIVSLLNLISGILLLYRQGGY